MTVLNVMLHIAT